MGISRLTAMFIHASWSHILGNMPFLAIFGNNVEDAFGHMRYLVLYVTGGLVAAASQTAVTPIAGTSADARVPMLGASGAIAAVLDAYLVLYPQSRILSIIGAFPLRIRVRGQRDRRQRVGQAAEHRRGLRGGRAGGTLSHERHAGARGLAAPPAHRDRPDLRERVPCAGRRKGQLACREVE
jgi:hypothetical protein